MRREIHSLFFTAVLGVSLAACAGAREKQQKDHPEGRQASGQAAEPGKADQGAALGEPRETTGSSQVTTKEQVTVERQTNVPTVRTERVGADINRMNIEQFVALGFSPEVARNIVTYRNEHGPFASVDQLKLVPGMNEGLFQQHSGKLAVRSGKPSPKG